MGKKNKILEKKARNCLQRTEKNLPRKETKIKLGTSFMSEKSAKKAIVVDLKNIIIISTATSRLN